MTTADLAEVLAECADLTATETAERMTSAVLGSGSGKPRDDILLLVLRIPPAV